MALIGNRINETTSAAKKVKVKVSSTEILAANSARQGCEIVVVGATAVDLMLGAAAVSEEGMRLIKEGGSWDGKVSDKVWTGSVFGISSAESTVTVTEV